jgi:hypothetical protein
MLEQAHERQFAISQLGTKSVRFEDEHTARIELALQTLFHHFTTHKLDELDRPTPPHADDLIDLRNISHRLEPLPLFEMSDLSAPEPKSLPPPKIPEKPSRSPLALQDLMNPEPIQQPRAKRKFSSNRIAPIPDERGFDVRFNLDHSSVGRSAFNCVSANHPAGARVARTYREARMRRLSRLKSGSPARST